MQSSQSWRVPGSWLAEILNPWTDLAFLKDVQTFWAGNSSESLEIMAGIQTLVEKMEATENAHSTAAQKVS